jgi:tetratricopeptide (TPR) repeat protein
MTGMLGFIAYMLLFGGIFRHGLTWLGLIRGRAQTRLFGICGTAGAVLGVVIPLLADRSLRLAGVGLPLGFVGGLAVYVAVFALLGMRGKDEGAAPTSALTGWPLILVVALIAAIVGHFVEINSGIAIAATRTYFWAFAAVLVAVGQGNIVGLSAASAAPANTEAPTLGRPVAARRPVATAQRLQRPGASKPVAAPPVWRLDAKLGGLLVSAGVMGWVLATLAWDYTTNPPPVATNAVAILVRSFTTLAAKGEPDTISLGMLLMVAGVWLVGLVLHVCEADDEGAAHDARSWVGSAAIYALASLSVGGIYALVHAAQLISVTKAQDLMFSYLAAGMVAWVGLGAVLYLTQSRPTKAVQGAWTLIVLLPLALSLLLIINANISPVRADVLYKQGLKYDGASSWDEAIYYYRESIKLAPKEDYYYLFWGRALMERAKTEEAVETRDLLFETAVGALEVAKGLNPLNTDHTANLGRLYRTWADLDTNGKTQLDKLKLASDYYAQAVTLSPRNAALYNEWGLVYYTLGDYDTALAKYQESLALDQEFAQTYLLIGDAYLTQQQWVEAVGIYEQAVTLEGETVQAWSALAYAQSKAGDFAEAISANLQVLTYAPDDYVTLKNLAILYRETAQPQAAIDAAARALAVAPDADKAAIEDLIAQEQAKLQKDGQTP